jgi:hypothetical protein
VEAKAKEICERYLELENLIVPSAKSTYFTYDRIIESPDDAETAARKLRDVWKLGYDPNPRCS